jgi:hypothetical protein
MNKFWNYTKMEKHNFLHLQTKKARIFLNIYEMSKICLTGLDPTVL